MKLRNIIIVLLSSLFLSSMTVNAQETLTIRSKNKNVDKEMGLTFELITSLKEEIIGGSFDIVTTSSDISFEKISLNEKFKTTIDGTKVSFTLKDMNDPIKLEEVLGSVSLKALEKAKVGDEVTIILNNIVFNTQNQEYKIPTTSQKFKIGKMSQNAKLKGLYSSLVKINFQPDKYVYQVNVSADVDELDLQAEAEDEKATVTISDQKLTNNVTSIQITVKGETGDKKEYKVVVTKNELESKETAKGQDIKAIKKPWILIAIGTFILIVINVGYIQYKNR